MLVAHRSKEEKSGHEIWPAVPLLASSSDGKLLEEERFCSQLDAASCMSKPELAW